LYFNFHSKNRFQIEHSSNDFLPEQKVIFVSFLGANVLVSVAIAYCPRRIKINPKIKNISSDLFFALIVNFLLRVSVYNFDVSLVGWARTTLFMFVGLLV